jgi:hypothetical protein
MKNPAKRSVGSDWKAEGKSTGSLASCQLAEFPFALWLVDFRYTSRSPQMEEKYFAVSSSFTLSMAVRE